MRFTIILNFEISIFNFKNRHICDGFCHFFIKFRRYFSYSSSVRFGIFFFFAISTSRIFQSMPMPCFFYSVRSAMTGSFFAAACAGMRPEMSVSATLTQTMTNAVSGGSIAMPAIPESE